MKFITAKQYWEHMKNDSFSGVKEEGTEYRLETEEKLYDEKKIREIGKKHDKMFRNILEESMKKGIQILFID